MWYRNICYQVFFTAFKLLFLLKQKRCVCEKTGTYPTANIFSEDELPNETQETKYEH